METSQVRLPEHLTGLDGLIIPGGESTTIGKLADEYGLMEPLREFGQRHAIWGTCAGAIFLSKDISRNQPLLGHGIGPACKFLTVMMIAIKLRLDQIDKSKIRQSDGCDDDDFCDADNDDVGIAAGIDTEDGKDCIDCCA